MGKISIDDITDKYVRPLSSEQEDILLNMLFDNNICFESVYSPKGDLYRVSPKVYQYLLQEGFGIELVEVKNIGSLPLEKRNEIKRHTREQQEKNRGKAIAELRREYGNL